MVCYCQEIKHCGRGKGKGNGKVHLYCTTIAGYATSASLSSRTELANSLGCSHRLWPVAMQP